MALFDLQRPWVFAFGILGNFVSICVLLAPLPTFIRIYKEKSTMGYQSLPYVVALFSATLWMYYALQKNAILLISINSLACVIETIYIVIYIFYASKSSRKYTIKLVATLNVGTFCAIFLLTNFAVQNEEIRVEVVGWICVAFSVSVFAAPLSIVCQVIRTRSAEFMPFTLSFALTLSAVLWFSYGILQKDMCVAAPNILGFFLGLLQMLLYGIYRNPKPLEVGEKKVAEHVINIVMLGNSEVHPVDSQTSSNRDYNSTISDHDEDENKDEEVDDHQMRPEDNNDEPACSQARPKVNIGQLDSPILVVCPAA